MYTKLLKPHFLNDKNETWFDALKRDVNALVKSSDKKIKWQMHLKAAVLLAGYATSYVLLLFYSSSVAAMFGWYVMLGLFLTVFFLNTAHDVAHNSFFGKAKWNENALFVLDILGDNSLIWKRRHVHYHHVFSNVQDWDMDIRQSPLVRILPQSKFHSFHKFQFIYMPLLYLFYSLHVAWYRDFYDLYSSDGLLAKAGIRDKMNVPRFYLFKFLNLMHLLFIPMLVIQQPWYLVFAGFIIMHMAGSIVAAIALVSAHAGEDAVFVQTGTDGNIDHSWAQHQLITTTDFATGNPLITQLFGGFNHHVAHHLFPSVSHGHYPAITKMIVALDKENHLGYKRTGLGKALLTHFHLLKNNSVEENIFDE